MVRQPRAPRRRTGRLIGRLGEWHARRWLRRRGLRPVARNVRAGGGEIDLIALEGEVLVFVEVRARTGGARGDDPARLDRRKRAALRRACRAWLAGPGQRVEAWRVDLVCVDFELLWSRIHRLRALRHLEDVLRL